LLRGEYNHPENVPYLCEAPESKPDIALESTLGLIIGDKEILYIIYWQTYLDPLDNQSRFDADTPLPF
jgi:hypothetical protein